LVPTRRRSTLFPTEKDGMMTNPFNNNNNANGNNNRNNNLVLGN
jgi:hypothetical protein